jgi:hypothetical protein
LPKAKRRRRRLQIPAANAPVVIAQVVVVLVAAEETGVVVHAVVANVGAVTVVPALRNPHQRLPLRPKPSIPLNF